MLKYAMLTVGLVGGAALFAQPPAPAGKGPAGGNMEKCAKACADCMTACEVCHQHCMKMLAQGQKDHHTTAAMTADCADICAAAARSSARMGPLSKEICEACAKACEKCGAECEKYPAAEMKECARACKECAAACREMVGHAGHTAK